jgi:phospholipid N-methyltransferase
MVGSIIPTSHTAVCGLLDPIDWKNVRCVVEYGPGTGVFTREILRRIGPEACLIAIDTNEVFIDYLRSAIDDRRLICVHGSATDVEAILAEHGHAQADYVISGLPFSTLPRPVADSIMDATQRAIRPGGAFLIYQYSRFVLAMLEARFGPIDTGKVWRCIPPAHLFWAWKKADSISSAFSGESLAAE